jgi:Uncharacterized conserved protein
MSLRTVFHTLARRSRPIMWASLSWALFSSVQSMAATHPDDLLVLIPPGQVEYDSIAETLKNGRPTAPQRVSRHFDRPLYVMKRQVSQAEFAQCVKEKACKVLDREVREDVSPDHPVVGVSWTDATDYARWYSKRTGRTYRLPTYAEWVHIAGEAFKESQRVNVYDSNNPAQQWLAEYALEAQRQSVSDPAPKPFGHYGSNKAGVQDLNGNVWEWTNTCSARVYLGDDGKNLLPPSENCGVRVVAGSHYSLITDFMRDPKSGACSVGIPPANLGIRLVRDDA